MLVMHIYVQHNNITFIYCKHILLYIHTVFFFTIKVSKRGLNDNQKITIAFLIYQNKIIKMNYLNIKLYTRHV